jgi:8-oxo-dGTP diphosphatase
MINYAGIVFTDGKSLLVLKRSNKESNSGTYDFPGGKSNKDETDIENAIREVQEETGIDKIPGKCFGKLSKTDKRKNYTMFFYFVKDEFDIKISDEHSKYKWVKITEIENLNLHPKVRDNISSYLKFIKKSTLKFSNWLFLRDSFKDDSINK